MKIILYINSMGAGGAERVTAHLVNAWARRGWKIYLVTQESQSCDMYSISPEVHRLYLGISSPSHNIISALYSNLNRIRILRGIIAHIRPDVCIGMTTTAAVLTIIATLGTGVKTIVSERIYPPLHSVGCVWSLLRRLTYPCATRVVMLSREGLGWLNREIPWADGVIIGNPCVLPLTDRIPYVDPNGIIGTNRNIILSVGRLHKQKQHNILIRAYASLASVYTNWDLVIIGEGDERNSLSNLISRCGLSGHVSLVGKVGNVSMWYKRASIFVMASQYEGFPNVLLEAMAHGCPAISYDCDTGPRDIIENGINGILVRPVGDIGKLRDSMEILMKDSAIRNNMASQCYRVMNKYTLNKIMSQWDQILIG